MQELQTLSDSTGISVAELEALIAGGVDPRQFVVADAFPEFIDGAQYKFRVMEVANTVTNKGKNIGQESAKLSCVAVDGDGQTTKAKAWIYAPYPFDTETYSWGTNIKGREIAQGTMEVLITATGEKKYQNFGQKVNDGAKNHFFDHDGKELVGKEISVAKAKALAARLVGMKDLQENPTPLGGVEFYATYVVESNEANPSQPWKKFKYISLTSRPDQLITDATKMQRRP